VITGVKAIMLSITVMAAGFTVFLVALSVTPRPDYPWIPRTRRAVPPLAVEIRIPDRPGPGGDRTVSAERRARS
jgi:hypothetical protein